MPLDSVTDPATQAVAVLSAAVDDLLSLSTGCLTGPEAREVLAAVVRQSRRVEAVQARLVRASIAGDVVALGDAGQAKARVVNALGDLHLPRGHAATLVDVAVVADPGVGELREVAELWAAGDTSLAHIDAARSTLTKIPGHLRESRREEIAACVAAYVTTWDPAGVKKVAVRILDRLTGKDSDDRFDPAAFDRRSFRMGTDSTGMLVTTGQHDPASGQYLKAVLTAMTHRDRPVPCSDGAVEADPDTATVGVLDTRSPAMRRHDALHEIVRAGAEALATGDATGRIGAALARVTIVTGPEALAGSVLATDDVVTHDLETSDLETGPFDLDPAPSGSEHDTDIDADDIDADDIDADDIDADDIDADVNALPEPATIPGQGTVSRGLLQRLACDAVLDHLIRTGTGRVVSLVSRGRLATPGMIRALIARDGGCAFPGCTRPPSVCDAHHVRWWSHGGPTEVDNLVLLCSHHHTTIHTGDWAVAMRTGVPWFRPPTTHPWRRTSFANACRRADLLGARLRRALDEHDRRPPPAPTWLTAGS